MEKSKEYYEGLDKRTNEYKQWKQEQLNAKFEENQTIGLGDVVEKITTVTGIKAIVEAFTPEGKDCGCDKRKDKLNNLFKNKSPLCLNVEEYEVLSDIMEREHIVKERSVSQSEQTALLKVYNRIFNVKKAGTSCNGCVRSLVKDLQAVYQTYK